MLIRYHCFYYALGILCLTLGKVLHPLFYLLLGGYAIFVYRRLSLYHLCLMILLCIIFYLQPHYILQLPSVIEGEVVKASEKYCYLKTDIGTVKLYHQEAIEYGDVIKAKVAPLELYENTNDYAFCEKDYLYGQKIFHKAYLQTLLKQQHHPTFYHWLEQRLSEHQDINDYQKLFILGERNESIHDDYQVLTDLSLVHMFALSGMHIHILYALIKNVLGLFLPRSLSRLITYLLIGFYIFSIPMLVSLYRAFFVLLLYDLLKKWLNKLDVFAILIMASLFYNPYIIFNISFVFSYFVYFIVLLTQHMRYSSFWIYLSSLPIILTLNAQIPLIAFFVSDILNLFIEYFYSLCIFSIIFPALEIILKYYVNVFQSILSFLETINHFIVFSKPTLAWLILFYFFYFRLLLRQEIQHRYRHDICALLSLMLVLNVWSQYKIYGEVTMIDVGQRDCTLIRLPMNQGHILIDTGGYQEYDLATQTIIPYLKSVGISHLDYVYISHDDFDHCGALDSLLEHFSVGQVIDSFEESRQIGCAHIQMLKSDKVYSDSNDQSLLMYVTLPAMNILFMGDASVAVEKDIEKQLQDLDVDVLKVSHHGSATATSATFLSQIHPEIAMIGVKKDNMYHHPSLEVIERLQRKGITILRTDQDGMFHIRFYGKERYILR